MLGFDDMDSIYASPEDFRRVKRRDKIRGLHLLEYFVNRCHEIGVSVSFPGLMPLSLCCTHIQACAILTVFLDYPKPGSKTYINVNSNIHISLLHILIYTVSILV